MRAPLRSQTLHLIQLRAANPILQGRVAQTSAASSTKRPPCLGRSNPWQDAKSVGVCIEDRREELFAELGMLPVSRPDPLVISAPIPASLDSRHVALFEALRLDALKSE